MKSYIEDIVVTDPNGEKAILYPNTKQEAVEGLSERFENVEKPDITEITETTMPNSCEGRLLFKEILGNTEQGENTSPANPQEIKSVSISGIRTHGKNFLNDSKAVNTNNNMYLNPEANIGSYDDLVYLPKGTYTMSYFDSGVYTPASAIYAYMHDKNKNRESSEDVSAWSGTVTFTLEEEKYIGYNVYDKNGLNSDYTKRHIMLEQGSARTDFETHKELSITFSQPIELNKIGDVQDVIADVKPAIRFAKAVLDGSSDENWILAESNIGFRADIINMGSVKGDENYQPLLCSHYSVEYTTDKVCCFLSSNIGNIAFVSDHVTSLDEWKTWLASNPITVVYELATPIKALPLADQIALNSLETFDGITYLEIDSPLQPEFVAEYGTSKVGGVALESLAVARNNDIRISSVEATVVNNI